MAVRLMMDQHVPAAITRGLRIRGVDVLTALEDGADTAPDEELLQRATDLGRMLVTQDDDHLEIAHEWQGAGRPFSGVVYCHQLNITIGQAIEHLELIAKCLDPEDCAGCAQFIPFH